MATQEDLQRRIGTVLMGVQGLWDVPNPTDHQDTVVRMLQFVLALADPSQEARLKTLLKLVDASEGDKTTVLQALLDTDKNSLEYHLVSYVLGDGNTVPSWPQVAAKVVAIAATDALAQVQPGGSKPAQTTPPASPASTPSAGPQSPADLLNTLKPPAASTPKPVPATTAAPQPTPTPTPTSTPASAHQPPKHAARPVRPTTANIDDLL